MCLAVPGKIIGIVNENDSMGRMARVDFSGVTKDISLAYLPEAQLQDYVVVHAGLALSILDEKEAAATLAAFSGLAANETD